MMKTMIKIMMIMVIVTVSSCATIINGSYSTVNVTSDPPMADIKVDGVWVGQTPFQIEAKASHTHIIIVELQGYKPESAQVIPKFNGWVFGNLIIGGIPGLIVDAASGSMYKLDKKEISFKLKPN